MCGAAESWWIQVGDALSDNPQQIGGGQWHTVHHPSPLKPCPENWIYRVYLDFSFLSLQAEWIWTSFTLWRQCGQVIMNGFMTCTSVIDLWAKFCFAALSKGAVVVLCSTVSPDYVRQLETQLAGWTQFCNLSNLLPSFSKSWYFFTLHKRTK